jgi:hypothetical protein
LERQKDWQAAVVMVLEEVEAAERRRVEVSA